MLNSLSFIHSFTHPFIWLVVAATPQEEDESKPQSILDRKKKQNLQMIVVLSAVYDR